jgi:hypothetical protein
VSCRDREFEFELELEKKGSDERLKKVVGVGGTLAAPGPEPALPDLFITAAARASHSVGFGARGDPPSTKI